MSESMIFPKTADEFIEQYKFTDSKQEYTNGAELISVYRVKQMMEHYFVTDNNVGGKCDYCQEDREGYRKALGSFFLANPFHGSLWQIKTKRTKPRQIFFCPMCGRKLAEPCGRYEPKTIADRIRAMTDDELNDLFREIYDAGIEDAVAYEWGQRTNSFEWTMEWLQQP